MTRLRPGPFLFRNHHTHSLVLLTAVIPVTVPSSLFNLFTMPANNTLSMPPNSIPRPYWLSSTQTGLLDLLPQHRKIIYDDLFKDHEIYAVEEDYDDRPIEPPILSVCRQIRNEARVLFYKTALIGIYEDSGPTFTSNIYNYSEKVQLSCYNDQMPDFWPLNQMRNLRHIHLIAYLGDNLGRQPHAEEGQQLLEAIKIDMKDEISLMQALKRRCPQAKVDIESNFWPMRLHSTRRVRCPRQA